MRVSYTAPRGEPPRLCYTNALVITVGVTCLAVALGMGQPEATPNSVRVSWAAPPSCPRQAVFEADIERLAGGALRVEPDGAGAVEVVISEQAGHYSLGLRLELGRQVQARTLSAPSCETLVRAAGLIAAVAVAPLAANEAVAAVETEPEVVASVVVEPIQAPATVTELEALRPVASDAIPPERIAEPRSRTPAPSRVLMSAHVGLGLGLVPNAALGIGGALGWQRGRFSLFAGAEHWFARTAPVDGGNVRVTASGGGLSGCWSPLAGAVEVPFCADVVVLALRGTGRGRGVVSRTPTEVWAGVGPRMGVRWWPWERVGVDAHASGRVALRRPGFHLARGSEEVVAFESPSLALAAVVGAIVRLP